MKIDASSFSLTRIVTFVPFYLLENRTKHVILISEEGQDNWTPAQPEQVRTKFSMFMKQASILLPDRKKGYISF